MRCSDWLLSAVIATAVILCAAVWMEAHAGVIIR